MSSSSFSAARGWRCAVLALAPIVSVLVLGSARAEMWKELREQPATDIARGETDFWVRTLGLSTEQADALQAINLRYASGMRVAARTSATDAAKLGALETLEDQKSEEILEILDPEQREKFTRFIEHRQRWVRK